MNIIIKIVKNRICFMCMIIILLIYFMGWGWIIFVELGYLWIFEYLCIYYLGVGVKSGNFIGLIWKLLLVMFGYCIIM